MDASRTLPFLLFLDAIRAVDDVAMTFRDLYLAWNELRPKISTIWRQDWLEWAENRFLDTPHRLWLFLVVEFRAVPKAIIMARLRLTINRHEKITI